MATTTAVQVSLHKTADGTFAVAAAGNRVGDFTTYPVAQAYAMGVQRGLDLAGVKTRFSDFTS